MMCPGCGNESVDPLGTCKHCGSAPVAGLAVPGSRPIPPADDLRSLRFEPERIATGQGLPGRPWRQVSREIRGVRGGSGGGILDDALEVGEDDLDKVLSAGLDLFGDDGGGPPFRIDDDLFLGHDPWVPALPAAAAASIEQAQRRDGSPAVGADPAEPAFAPPDEEHGHPLELEPIIDRDDEVPERYWAPEIAGLRRRALALLVDQLLLLAVLGLFFLGALAALEHNSLTAGWFLTADGLQASALPFALLAALLSLAASSFFHGSTGRTPGKALVGIEVRTGDGGAVTWGRAILRWLGAALGLACAGAGSFWALFEPRRRGWADLISGTVVARPQRESPRAVSRR